MTPIHNDNPTLHNMTFAERERAAYVAGEIALSDALTAVGDVTDECAGLQSQIEDLPTLEQAGALDDIRQSLELLLNELDRYADEIPTNLKKPIAEARKSLEAWRNA